VTRYTEVSIRESRRHLLIKSCPRDTVFNVTSLELTGRKYQYHLTLKLYFVVKRDHP
jgi:hypothetical protein